MTHMHIPDGILPVWLWLSGLFLMALALSISVVSLRSMDAKKKIPLLGAVSAVMLVAMSLEILPIAYHINLSVVAGILLGPALGFVAAFITNLILALMGHGGITVVGLNTLLLGAEAVLGHVLFSLMGQRLPVFWRAASVTVLTLFATTLLLIGIVSVSHIDVYAVLHDHGAGIHDHEASDPAISTFAIIVLSLGSIGWFIEAAITGAVVKFVAQVKPELLRHGLHDQKRSSGR
jgi:cobalt/nickel transport system permease protein